MAASFCPSAAENLTKQRMKRSVARTFARKLLVTNTGALERQFELSPRRSVNDKSDLQRKLSAFGRCAYPIFLWEIVESLWRASENFRPRSHPCLVDVTRPPRLSRAPRKVDFRRPWTSPFQKIATTPFKCARAKRFRRRGKCSIGNFVPVSKFPWAR